MKKLVLLIVSLFLFTSCADIFCDIVNNWDARKEAKKNAEGAGKLPYAVSNSEINMYVISKSGWQEVYWNAPHVWGDESDFKYRPRFWQMEATVTPYPSSDEPLVYIVQYPQIVIDSTMRLSKWGNKEMEAAFAPREHCASWEVVSSDKRVAPVLMAGDGGFPYKRSNVIELLNGYCSEMKLLQATVDTLEYHSARILQWDFIKSKGMQILDDRCHNIPSLSFDPGYHCPSAYYGGGMSLWMPQWTSSYKDNSSSTGGGGDYTEVDCGSHFYHYYNSFDESGWGKPLENPASSIMDRIPVGGYKYGRYSRMISYIDYSVDIIGDVAGYVTEQAVSMVTYYCILPEASGSTYPIWCQNPEDWK